MSDRKETEGILYRHFTIMNQELEHLRGLINELDSKIKHLQEGLNTLEAKTSSEDSRLQSQIEKNAAELGNVNNELKKGAEALSKDITEVDGRLAERATELNRLKDRLDKELAPFSGPVDKLEIPSPSTLQAAGENSVEDPKEKFIADIQASKDAEIEELAETIEAEGEGKKRKRK